MNKFFLWFCLICFQYDVTLCERHVTLSCGENEDVVIGLPGPPGTRGAIGPQGDRGPPGLQGEPGDSNTWKEAFVKLSHSFIELQKRMDQQRKVQHFRIPPFQVTWTLGKQYCERLSLKLCSYSEIFPFSDNVPFIIGVQKGDHWTPIRDISNDWVQVGTVHSTGLRHAAAYEVPGWGEQLNNSSPIKGHLFCCV